MTQAKPTRDFPIGPFAASAAAWLDAPRQREEASTPARAATVMLVRGEPLEVFMIERAATMDFAPSTWVFPGGRVDPADAGVLALDDVDLDLPLGGVGAWARRLGTDDETAVAVLVCALRELFEEAGVLLASEVNGPASGPLVDTTGASWRERRTQVEAHEVAFTEAVRDLRLRGDLVEAVDRWVTPEFEKRRFDTWFLTALLPQGARAEAVSRESQRGRWVRPETMLDECASGAAQLLPPTRIALERLSRSADAAQALTQARACSFVPTHPRAVRGQNGLHLQAEVNL